MPIAYDLILYCNNLKIKTRLTVKVLAGSTNVISMIFFCKMSLFQVSTRLYYHIFLEKTLF